MDNINQLINRDLKHIWHPCAQMKDFESVPLLFIESARGSYLSTNYGELIDAISSWWCKPLGHRHPAIVAALNKQLEQFEHVIAANTTHAPLVYFGEKLADITKKQHVFFASDGSSAVEIALKMALHAQQINGRSERRTVLALKNGYHGETFGALSVSDLGIYKKPYEGNGVTSFFIDPVYVNNTVDPLWNDCSREWQTTLLALEPIKDTTCALIVEPLLQGSAGMRLYSADFLKRLATWAKENNIFFIADEIMTGLGRTGKWLALDHAGIEADFVCLSKGLTAGALPLSTVSIDHQIFNLFYNDYQTGHSFLHSHTHSANALAVCAALATLEVIENEHLNDKAIILGQQMQAEMQNIAATTGKLTNIRGIGGVVAAEMVGSSTDRLNLRLANAALKRGALLRPIGNCLYWLPPLNTDSETIVKLAKITLESINSCYK